MSVMLCYMKAKGIVSSLAIKANSIGVACHSWGCETADHVEVYARKICLARKLVV